MIFKRLWLWLPDWAFRVLGVLGFGAVILPRVPQYLNDFWSLGFWYAFDEDTVVRMPWAQVLIDLTLLLIVISFVVRSRPRQRAVGVREVLLPLTAAFMPFIPWWIAAFGRATHASWADDYQLFMMDPSHWSRVQFVGGSALMVLGNAIDVWGYGTLLRSLSIAAEVRELKVTGPYRLVRHPIYLGQMLSQAGIWLFYAQRHAVWIAFWATFVALQLYRSRIEDEVLERALGEGYLEWKRKTFWFV